jgi:hypothetical protein
MFLTAVYRTIETDQKFWSEKVLWYLSATVSCPLLSSTSAKSLSIVQYSNTPVLLQCLEDTVYPDQSHLSIVIIHATWPLTAALWLAFAHWITPVSLPSHPQTVPTPDLCQTLTSLQHHTPMIYDICPPFRYVSPISCCLLLIYSILNPKLLDRAQRLVGAGSVWVKVQEALTPAGTGRAWHATNDSQGMKTNSSLDGTLMWIVVAERELIWCLLPQVQEAIRILNETQLMSRLGASWRVGKQPEDSQGVVRPDRLSEQLMCCALTTSQCLGLVKFR